MTGRLRRRIPSCVRLRTYTVDIRDLALMGGDQKNKASNGKFRLNEEISDVRDFSL